MKNINANRFLLTRSILDISRQFSGSFFALHLNICRCLPLTCFILLFCSRFKLALQQNEILDIFYDDYFSLADDETTFGAKSDNYLKVCTVWLCSSSMVRQLKLWAVRRILLSLTPRVKPWVIQSFLAFDSMDRTLKCDYSLESC